MAVNVKPPPHPNMPPVLPKTFRSTEDAPLPAPGSSAEAPSPAAPPAGGWTAQGAAAQRPRVATGAPMPSLSGAGEPPPVAGAPVRAEAPVAAVAGAPAPQPAAPPQADPTSVSTHTVAAGDNLWKLARRFAGEVAEAGQPKPDVAKLHRELLKANPHVDTPERKLGDLIYPGDVLKLPASVVAARQARAAAQPAAAQAAQGGELGTAGADEPHGLDDAQADQELQASEEPTAADEAAFREAAALEREAEITNEKLQQYGQQLERQIPHPTTLAAYSDFYALQQHMIANPPPPSEPAKPAAAPQPANASAAPARQGAAFENWGVGRNQAYLDQVAAPTAPAELPSLANLRDVPEILKEAERRATPRLPGDPEFAGPPVSPSARPAGATSGLFGIARDPGYLGQATAPPAPSAPAPAAAPPAARSPGATSGLFGIANDPTYLRQSPAASGAPASSSEVTADDLRGLQEAYRRQLESAAKRSLEDFKRIASEHPEWIRGGAAAIAALVSPKDALALLASPLRRTDEPEFPPDP